MKLIQLILIVLFFNSCAAIGKKTLLYGKCKKGYLACTQFELKNDQTFEFYIFMDVGGGHVINGTWDHVNGDSLRLNTFERPEIPKTYFKGRINNELQNRVKIQISDHEIPLTFADVEINHGQQNAITNEEGICYFNVEEIKNITYYYLGSRKEKIDINNPELNEIEIFVRDFENGVIPKYFVDKLVVANNREIIIYPNDSENNCKLKRSRFGRKYWK